MVNKHMAEYLSPGVYVEEFESGSRPMEGVSTSTAGFIGLAVKGADTGIPQLVTNFGDFRRKYGGYLPETEFGEYRLPWSISSSTAEPGRLSCAYLLPIPRKQRAYRSKHF
jgi:hypothetical protein